DRDHLPHIRQEAEQGQLALCLLHLFGNDEDNPQPGTADVIELCHIDREMRRAAPEEAVEAPLGRMRRAAVEPAREPDDRDLARLFVREFHVLSSAGLTALEAG